MKNLKQIVITATITDKDTLEAYADVHPELILDDFCQNFSAFETCCHFECDNPNFKSDHVEFEDFKFRIGQKVIFHGLLANPEYNGQVAIIKAYRRCNPNEHCPSGRGYYLEEPIPWLDDWVYEERLKPIDNQAIPDFD